MPEPLHHSPEIPAQPVESRREFLKNAAIGATSFSIATLVTSKIMESSDHDPRAEHVTIKAQEHDDQPDMQNMLQRELARPINQDPEKWLDEHQHEWQECFDCSCAAVTDIFDECIDERMLMDTKTKPGVRILRLAGSGILWKNIDELVDAIVAQVTMLARGRLLSSIVVHICSHKSCGAAGLKFAGQADPDQSARDYQRNLIVAKLRERGVNAVFDGDAPMTAEPHTGIATAIDCTGGRLQRLPGIKAYTITALGDIAHAIEEAILSFKIASGDHAYGNSLHQYTFIVFTDPSHPIDSQEILTTLEQKTRALKGQGMDIRIVTRQAPEVKQVP